MDLGAASEISKMKSACDGKVFFNGNMHSKILVVGAYEEKLKFNPTNQISA
jgi:hypothetical protein